MFRFRACLPVAVLLLVFAVGLGSLGTIGSFCSAEETTQSIAITTDFPGGNVLVDSIEGDTVHLRPDLRDTQGDWFYFAFRVTGAEGRKLHFVFEKNDRVGALGPAVSTDDGQTWRFLQKTPDASSRDFWYTFGAEERSVLFAVSMLYTQKNWDAFVQAYRARPEFQLSTLCTSRKGRPVELLRIVPEKTPDFAVVLTARHHACEMTANFLLEGILAEVMADTEDGRWLREHCEFFVVPFVDKDGVEEGDQGKNRRPHDHNRDYVQAIYPEIQAIQREVRQRYGNLPICFTDLHCPWLRYGKYNEALYSSEIAKPEMQVELKKFSGILEQTQKNGAIPYAESNNLHFGTEWNVPANFESKPGEPATMSSTMWFATLPTIQMAITWELPYANASGTEVNPTTAHELGENLAKALRQYLVQALSEKQARAQASKLKILAPAASADRCYAIAAAEFQKYYAQVTGQTLEILTELPKEVDESTSFIVIGSDAVNPFVRQLVERGRLADLPLKTASDDYRILSVPDGKATHLILAGGRGRSTLYAVYDFFERRANCSWFWDGDIVPKSDTIDLTGLDITESPRFEYRGLRYFAHRGLTRFQAEHWGLEDWKREIDWMLKKRLNVFMLRIGMDDVFQKAFPDVVHYPDPAKPLPEAQDGFDNRSLFWSLEYRGKLRKALLAYAFERDVMHPEDFGTMTHWYSRTPKEFLEAVKPEFVPQTTNYYNDPTALVWDIRQDKHLENYWKLTETHIANYGQPVLFHTIGLAERNCYADRKENLKLKLYTYRRLIQKLRQHYPNGKLLLAGWDFYNQWRPEEVREFISQLDPENTLIWDYEGDADGENQFQNWDVVGKFPYVFGIFLAYESALEIRGRYDIIEPRLKVVQDDPYCRGCILWPESSHTDIFMLHYFTQTAWKPNAKPLDTMLAEFCQQRYRTQSDKLHAIWKAMLPISQHVYWDGTLHMFGGLPNYNDAQLKDIQAWKKAARQFPIPQGAAQIFRQLAEVEWTDDFVRRDSLDLARTLADRLRTSLCVELMLQMHQWKAGEIPAEWVRQTAERYECVLEGLTEMLALHEDYSLAESFERLNQIEPIQNPDFGRVLLDNATCPYCESPYQYEAMKFCYVPALKQLPLWVKDRLDRDDKSDFAMTPEQHATFYTARQAMLNTPLLEMRPTQERTVENFRKCLLKLAEATGRN